MEVVEKKRTVVVVGGGVAGALLAKSLQFHADLVLIDPKEYLEIPWAEMRAKVEPSFAERSIMNHREYLINARIITSAAIDVTPKDVLTEDGTLIPYNYLVIATGHRNSVPKNKTDRIQQLLQENQKIIDSNSVLIVGGGPSGVELAAEIATDFPTKKVTIVHKGPRLVEFIGAKASTKSLDWLSKKKVDVLLDQSIDVDPTSSYEQQTFQTSTGRTVSADSYFSCVGKPVGSSWLKSSFLKDSLDGDGRVMVDEYLRVRGKDNIFAIGDITDIREIKQGFLAQKHAKIALKNLQAIIVKGNDIDTKELWSYKPGTSIAIISLGRKEGVLQLPFTTIGGYIPGYIKSRDLFVGRTRKKMGLNPRVE